MSFELALRTCHLGPGQKKSRKTKNPFTKEDMEIEVFDDQGLTNSEKKAVREVLDQAKSGDGDAGPYEDLDLRFPDGGVVAVWAGGLEREDRFEGFSFTVWKATAEVAKLLFKLSQAGNLIIVPAGEGVDPWVTSTSQQKLVAARWPNAKVITTEGQMQTELERAAPILEVED
jgi:hypothetical protein